MMKHKDFCAMILTHGRPDRVLTLTSLRRSGYTGKVFIVIDDEDKKASEYRRQFRGMVQQFCKKDVAAKIDEMDNFHDRRAIVYARNASFDIAERLGYRYFIQLDDDYTRFEHRAIHTGKLRSAMVQELDYVFDQYLDFFVSVPQFASVALAQNGDFIGGIGNGIWDSQGKRRKAMNTFFCDTQRRFAFNGRMNEDVNTYTLEQSRGLLFLTVPSVAIGQVQTQAGAGGMSDLYKASGTYQKSFYSVMGHPSSVKVKAMATTHVRIHHSVEWPYTAPCILPESLRKP